MVVIFGTALAGRAKFVGWFDNALRYDLWEEEALSAVTTNFSCEPHRVFGQIEFHLKPVSRQAGKVRMSRTRHAKSRMLM